MSSSVERPWNNLIKGPLEFCMILLVSRVFARPPPAGPQRARASTSWYDAMAHRCETSLMDRSIGGFLENSLICTSGLCEMSWLYDSMLHWNGMSQLRHIQLVDAVRLLLNLFADHRGLHFGVATLIEMLVTFSGVRFWLVQLKGVHKLTLQPPCFLVPVAQINTRDAPSLLSPLLRLQPMVPGVFACVQ